MRTTVGGESRGLLVGQAGDRSHAIGIQPGDVVPLINDRPLTTAEALEDPLSKPGRHVALRIHRQDMSAFVPADLG